MIASGDPETEVNWIAIERLFLRPWWRRVWTLQEFLISDRRHLRFYCGKRSISRRDFDDAVYAIYILKVYGGKEMNWKAFYRAWNRRRMHQWYDGRKGEMGLVALMAYVGDCKASDERDRVYSLLGVANDSKMMGRRDPDSSVEDVYTTLVLSFIKEHNSLDIVCYSHLFNSPRSEPDQKRLPSWIPDWRTLVTGKVIPVMACQGSKSGTGNFRPPWIIESNAMYKASGDTHPKILGTIIPTIKGTCKVLSCYGFIVDKIDGLGASAYNDAGKAETEEEKKQLGLVDTVSGINRRPDFGSAATSELMEIISRSIALDRDDRYLAEGMAPDRFKKDFETFCRTMLDNPDIVPTPFQEWFSLYKTLCIRGRTLGEHVATLPPTPVTCRDFGDPNGLKIFFERFSDTAIMMARRIILTEEGYLGMAACRAKRGDLICVLFGCSIPVLLREAGNNTYSFIGECYLDGFMNGQALEKDRGLAETQFEIV